MLSLRKTASLRIHNNVYISLAPRPPALVTLLFQLVFIGMAVVKRTLFKPPLPFSDVDNIFGNFGNFGKFETRSPSSILFQIQIIK